MSRSSSDILFGLILALIVLTAWGFVIYAGYFVTVEKLKEL